jgi:hypothetical protein
MGHITTQQRHIRDLAGLDPGGRAGLNLPHDASRLGLLEALADAAADSLG